MDEILGLLTQVDNIAIVVLIAINLMQYRQIQSLIDHQNEMLDKLIDAINEAADPVHVAIPVTRDTQER